MVASNSQTWEVEIGCGKGKFLLARAEENPKTFFIGIDKAGKWMKKSAARLEKKRLNNLKFIKGDVREVLEKIIPKKSVDVFHIYFPDPWPKRRHNKRRTLDGDFFLLLHERLKSKGLIEIATDYLDYFNAIKKVLSQSKIAWKKNRETINERLFCAETKTNYELKYTAARRDLYYLELQK